MMLGDHSGLRRDGGEAEQGFMLLGLIVAIFFILLALGIAAPTVAKQMQREREVEAMHRGDQYVRAIQLFYKKTGTYPGSLEALEKTNNIRFLRQRYVDPMTGKADWRLIHVGEAKTTVKGFFGQPLTGMAPGLGAASGMASPGAAGTGAAGSSTGTGFGGSSTGSPDASGASSNGSSSFGSSSSGSSFGSSAGSGSGVGAPGAGGSTGGGFGSGGSQSATGFSGSGAPFVGVGMPKHGDSMVVLNEQTTYQTWEFIYDPRIEQLKAKANLLGGGPASTDAGSLGTASGMSSGVGGTGSTGSGFGSSSFGSSGSSSGFGSSGGFGSTPASGAGSSGSFGSPGTPQGTQAPQ